MGVITNEDVRIRYKGRRVRIDREAIYDETTAPTQETPVDTLLTAEDLQEYETIGLYLVSDICGTEYSLYKIIPVVSLVLPEFNDIRIAESMEFVALSGTCTAHAWFDSVSGTLQWEYDYSTGTPTFSRCRIVGYKYNA